MQHYDELPLVESTLTDFYDRYGKGISAYIRLHLASWEDAEDMTCEVFLAAFAHKTIVTWPQEQQLAWLRRVAHNKVADHYRRTAHLATVSLEQVMEAVQHDEVTPERIALRREELQRLFQAVAGLPLVQQQVLRLRFGDSLPFAEIAVLLNMREDAVRKLCSRTLARLRTFYE